jgi:hypothetical protein
MITMRIRHGDTAKALAQIKPQTLYDADRRVQYVVLGGQNKSPTCDEPWEV